MKIQFKLGLGTVLLALLFMGTTGFAAEMPVSIKWSGTVTDTAIDIVGPDPLPLAANLIDAQAKGSFGATNVSVLTEFFLDEFLCDEDGNGLPDEDVLPLTIAYSRPVITFANGDQLWGDVTEGWLCLNAATGYFTGAAEGEYEGGSGRFAGATGSFDVPFWGKNLTISDLGVGFGAIQGEITGMVELP